MLVCSEADSDNFKGFGIASNKDKEVWITVSNKDGSKYEEGLILVSNADDPGKIIGWAIVSKDDASEYEGSLNIVCNRDTSGDEEGLMPI